MLGRILIRGQYDVARSGLVRSRNGHQTESVSSEQLWTRHTYGGDIKRDHYQDYHSILISLSINGAIYPNYLRMNEMKIEQVVTFNVRAHLVNKKD